eukprot:COSAG06_NODE_829_length_12043_cov_8.656983_17_plen_81_part_00
MNLGALISSFEQQPWAIEAVWTTSSLTIPPGTFGGQCSQRKSLCSRPEKAPFLRSINTEYIYNTNMMGISIQARDKHEQK